MRATVMYGAHDVRVETVPDARLVEPTDAPVRVTRAWSTTTVDVSSREEVHALVERAAALGDIAGFIHAAGVSPTQASPATILKVDLDGGAPSRWGDGPDSGETAGGDRADGKAGLRGHSWEPL